MPVRLLSTGSNGANQLGHSGREDTASFQPCLTPLGLTAVGDLAFGANHTVGLFRTTDEADSCWQVWGCGDGQLGQLGDGWTQTDDGFRCLTLPLPPVVGSWVPTHVACSWTTSFVAFARAPSSPSSTTATSLVLALGSNDFSELGSGIRGSIPLTRQHWHVFDAEAVGDLQAGPRHVMLVLRGGDDANWRVLGWGAARHGQLARQAERPTGEEDGQLSTLKHPVTTDTPSLVLYAGDPHVEIDQAPVVALGFAHSVLSFSASGTVIRLGGALTNAGLHEPPPAPLAAPVQSTWHHNVYRLPNGRTAAFGRPSALTAGESKRVVTLGADESVVVDIQLLATGSEHVVALTQAGTVWAWGWNEHGNLGDGSTVDGTNPKCVWPPAKDVGPGGRPLAVWAGCSTSWVLVEQGD